MAQLVTLTEVKLALGIEVDDTTRDAQLTQAIEDASRAVLNYTDRDFGTAQVTEPRIFEYDGAGYLEIDDCTTITNVSITTAGATAYTMTTYEWEPEPRNGEVFTHLLLPHGYLSGSPEMGFKSNLDKYPAHVIDPTLVTVTATWGWPTVPHDVRRAVVWTAVSFAESPRPFTTESIADYSHSISTESPNDAIPPRARELLETYKRIHV